MKRPVWIAVSRACAIAGSWIALSASEAQAARLPDWAKSVVAGAPSLPEAVPRETARVLFAETRTEVQPEGQLKIRRRFAYQALSATADEVGLGSYFWDDDAKMETSRGWHLPPGERAEKTYKEDAFDLSLQDAFLTDNKLRHVRVHGIKRGSIVFFEFTATETPRMMSWIVPFYEGEPVLEARYELEMPPGWTVRTAWLRKPGPDSEVTGNTRFWKLRDLPGIHDEPLSEKPSNEAPMLVVSVAPPPGVKLKVPVVPDWVSFGTWYEGIAQGRDAVEPEVAEASRKALLSSGATSFDRILAAATFVRDNVRYIAKEIGIGSIQPRPAKETLSNLYGDCKDKGTLFRSVLAAAGGKSYPVLINVGAPERVSDQIPAFWFDHFIVAVPVPSGESVPPRFAHSVVEAGELGRLAFVDTTDEYLSIGWISAALAGRKGLVVAGPSTRLVTLPDEDAAAHRMERALKIDFKPDRSLEVERATRYYGQLAAASRFEHRRSSLERRKQVERTIARVWIGAVPTDYSIEYEAPDGAFLETIRFTIPPLPSSGSGSEIAYFPDASDVLPRAPLGKRSLPVVYEFPCTLRLDTTIAHAPAGSSLPSQESRGEGWSSSTTYVREGDVVHAVWQLQLASRRFPPEAFPQLRKLWAAISSASASVMDLSAPGPVKEPPAAHP